MQVSHIVVFRSISSNPSEAYASTCPFTGPMSIDDGISTSLINRQSSQLYRAEAEDVLLDGHMPTYPMLPLQEQRQKQKRRNKSLLIHSGISPQFIEPLRTTWYYGKLAVYLERRNGTAAVDQSLQGPSSPSQLPQRHVIGICVEIVA